MSSFQRTSNAYASSSADLVLISEIEPPRRNDGVAYFERERMMAVLKGFAEGAVIPPIEVNEMTDLGKYRYRVQNGFHTFYASLQAGFELIPVVVKPYFDINDL